jgi:hypothetical protein
MWEWGENRFKHTYTQFNAALEATIKQKIIAIQRRICTLDQRYYDGLINLME